MIGLDTNVLVRLFAADDRVQTDAARRLIDEADESAFVNIVTVVELLWVLRRAYRVDDDRLTVVVRKLTEHPRIVCGEKDLMREAAHRSKENGEDMPDAIIALLNKRAGCRTTFTFDREAAYGDDFTLISMGDR
ncbi:PIN domain-containing protein [Hansschlegelia sp. KR7-227]|uniref:PIN domain-containing protein n=1 Tax=Hansschlegelia sp. KR7-227 TaxID=3400914 RepID=UPI003BFB6C16